MNDLRYKIRESFLLSLVVCLMLGALMSHAYAYTLFLLVPFGELMDGFMFSGQEVNTFLDTLIFNIIYSIICGAVVAVIAIGILQYLLRPKTLLFPEIVAIPYVFLGYWWFIGDPASYSSNINNEQIIVPLLSMLAAIVVWFVCAWLIVRRNSPNKSLNMDAQKARAS